MKEPRGYEYTTDLLVIGCGFSGMWAAMRARDFLDDVKPGEVVVIDNGGRLYCTVWGDIMTFVAAKNGVEGTVIDGVCRDIPGIRENGYPIFTQSTYMVTGKDRVTVDYVNQPVAVSGVQVCPGDYIVGDDTGVVCVPASLAERVAEIAEGIEKTEQAIIAEVKNGSTLKAARAKLGYHHLQTKEEQAWLFTQRKKRTTPRPTWA